MGAASRTRRERNLNVVAVVLGVMTVVMFALATVHFAAVGEYAFREFLEDWVPDSSSRSGSRSRVLGLTTGNINVRYRFLVSTVRQNVAKCFLGNSLVIWRAWGLWGQSYRAILIPASLWVVTLSKSTSLFWTTEIYLHPHTVVAIVSIWLTSSPLHSVPGATYTYASYMTVWATLVLATNMWTVGMISSVYW